MSAPRVSVLLPVYNAERYVTDAVHSIFRQTFDDFELIALDDGSSDSSLERLRRCQGADSRMRVVSRPNTGLVDALNEMLSLARGEFVARMDADDVSRPHRFALQINYLEANPLCVALGTRALFVDPEGCPIFEFIQHFSHDDVERALLRPEIGILHPTVMMRRQALERVGGYRHGYKHVEDLDLFLRLAEIGRLANLPEVLLEYRVHTGSVSHTNNVEQNESGIRAVRHALQRRGARVLPDDLRPFVFRPESAAELHRKWAWWALGARNLATARKHAFRATVKGPTQIENWRVLACSVRGF